MLHWMRARYLRKFVYVCASVRRPTQAGVGNSNDNGPMELTLENVEKVCVCVCLSVILC
jgi:hypothetical protein